MNGTDVVNVLQLTKMLSDCVATKSKPWKTWIIGYEIRWYECIHSESLKLLYVIIMSRTSFRVNLYSIIFSKVADYSPVTLHNLFEFLHKC